MKKIVLSILILLCLSDCSHGPQISVCSSFPSASTLNCANSSGALPSIPYATAAAAGYVVYAQQSEQSFLDYCEARNIQGTEPPQFSRCSFDMKNQGFDCVYETCEVNGFQNGISCAGGATSFVVFVDSLDFIALSPADDQTVRDYCNAELTGQ